MKNTFARLMPSKIKGAGVGAFAIKKIPKGTNPFIGSETNLRIMSSQEFDQLSPEEKKMITDFCYQSKGNWRTPINFNKLDISWYVNSSQEPNLSFDTQTGQYVALRDISPSEELTYDYVVYD